MAHFLKKEVLMSINSVHVSAVGVVLVLRKQKITIK